LSKLEGGELTEAVKEEMKLRRKELNKDISFQDVINFRTPELVGEYVGKCVNWMKWQEEQFKIENNYIDNPPSKKSADKKKSMTVKLSRQDRAKAVDLIIEIHRKYGLVPETLFVATKTLDRYFGSRNQRLSKAKDIEAVGVAWLLIASKYEDIYPPALDEMIKMMAKPSSRKEILEWEFRILKELTFHITAPTPFRFLERFASTSVLYQNALPLAQYIIELAIYDFDIIYNLSPSEIAAIGLFTAANFDIYSNKMNPKQKWSSEIAKESSMKKGKIIEYFNTYFVDLAFRVERELKVNDINVKYPQFQFVDDQPLAIFSPIR
jgi:transcription initiation factor TFIIIB Brf1 subunit/transcription initiation factor TFIIB